MRITAGHKRILSEILHYGLVEIKTLCRAGKSAQAAELAKALHNLPRDMWHDDFSLELFRDGFLIPYQEKYPKGRGKQYVAIVNDILEHGEDPAEN